ncbi:MAG: hypothetical protein K6E49_05720 [Lachnospiraceae bacterium]|nr:hypothetical protein [Lachnospiraceae bacterium]
MRSRRRRRRIVRRAKKTFINLVFAPARVPRISSDTVDLLMRLCEIAALTFVCVLIVHIVLPQMIKTGIVVISGVAFAGLLGAIWFSDYQRKIEQYRYYGFRI